ncbi:GntR family transcriptional regulator [Natronosporangium hydrolyticum]|uniref:GntR family transcriptional regulator n=1 Tax=Natronosporangium hydrolyticum TaxID=2811111 RepID=A0A895YIW1_9ACTN|nr:GntR family transcriptional regulator [Natronosporangium hydrolyticum]QSB15972.1 GntR family transcriptional regulator [Natronosporangium hydrolyticum]
MPGPTEPPYARIAAELSRRIADRELTPGDKVPSTRHIAREFGVALATATKALEVLRADGLVVTRPRSGTVVAPRHGYRTPGEAGGELDRDQVVREAIAIADADGLKGVSMRAVAGRCSAAPMSLYRFVDSKDELLSAMADRVYRAMPLAEEVAGSWRSRIEELSRALWRVHRAHPWLGQIQPLTRPLPLPGLLTVTDRILGALADLGLPPKLRFDVQVLLYNHIVGLSANFEREAEAASQTGISAEEWADLQYLPRTGDPEFMSGVPHFAEIFGHFGSLPGYDLDLDDLFELGLELLLDGVEAVARRRPAQ